MDKKYDLEDRTERFTKLVIGFCKKLPKVIHSCQVENYFSVEK